MNTNSYILPETGHYESIKELLSLLIEHKKGYTLPYEQGIFSAPKDKFEKVRKDDGDYLFIPTNSEYQHLYRGQNFILEEGKKCQPSLYRKLLSKEQQFIEWIRYYEFEAMLKYHPIVRNVFLENDFFVDYSGLAQHYGLLTDKLDFTSDPEIAGFFATCIYNSDDNCYEPITNNQ